MAHEVTGSLEARAEGAVKNAFLQQALDVATERFITLRQAAYAEFQDPLAVRLAAKAARERAIARLDENLARLAENVRRAGGHVHWAATASEARAIVVGIARERGVRTAVKSKSMASEEIHLNQALEAAGVRPVETDLGEWIIQLSGETPSHIIAPAIHLTKAQVAALLSKHVGRDLPAEAEALVAVAKQALREEFIRADMGITGVNFAVAETGTIVLVTNEGNGRLVTSHPRIHVALMGVDKVIETLDDLAALMRVLPRAATGQKLSVYMTMVTGPRRPDEADGPDEFHLVVMDNGRSRVLRTPMEEALQCLRCGACLNVCPVYREIGGHAYGAVYAGPIGMCLTPMIDPSAEAKSLCAASTLCGACLDACPVVIDIPGMLLHLRAEAVREGAFPWWERLGFRLLAYVLNSPALYRLAGRLGAKLTRPLVQDGWIRRLPSAGDRWTRLRDLPPIAERPFRERWKDLAVAESSERLSK
jgi:L-lactate dehydrogenase complex protein LldF